ncbi:endonuclease domain-containing protein [Candidatus Laterigemmans baculatus]|uniref:endonuclease domain-containing protein n=1 Tax=Candidatus Laterigemmans baculatus TaxID=2770505 RepID=UPI0028F45413|nr:DUF559 domain-containing protein [Candidatus Laterigemmans baculatus]
MMTPRPFRHAAAARARELRAQQTKAESLLWQVVRGRRLCGLKFRRQYPIDPYFADFACIERRLVVEVDGGYHDYIYENDCSRQTFIERQGWTVIRFANEDILEDVDRVAVAICRRLGLEPTFRGRKPR